MSIINDALKKADHLKKWKTFSGASLHNDSSSTRITVQEASSSVIEDVKIEAEQQKSEPPFRVHFETPPPKQNRSIISTVKLVTIIVLTCSLFVLLLGPWLYMWVNQDQSEGKVQRTTAVIIPPRPTPKVERPPVPALVSTPNALPETSISDTRPAQTETPPVPPKPQYKEYLTPNANVAIKPVPRTFRRIIPMESRYQLTGISVLGTGDRVAIINGKVIKEGAIIDSAEVISIGEQKVTLKKKDKEFSLNLD